MPTSCLFSEYRRRVLGLLLLRPLLRFHVREIARLTNTVAGSLHRELAKLAKAKILLREKSGNQVYYQANTALPIFEELASILRKTSGLVDILITALAPLSEKIKIAFIFGSIAAGKENIMSDIDILVIGKASFAEIVSALFPVQSEVGREINPKVYQEQEWLRIINDKNAFALDVLNKPKLFIIGKENDLSKFNWHEP